MRTNEEFDFVAEKSEEDQELEYDVNRLDIIQETIEALEFRAHHLKSLLDAKSKWVITEPCGTGKTLASAEFISKYWKSNGILFSAQRKKSINHMKKLLITLGVPEEYIGVYHSGTKEAIAMVEDIGIRARQIALVTHLRLQIEPSERWLEYKNDKGQLCNREYTIIDEPVKLVDVMKIDSSAAEILLSKILTAFRINNNYDISIDDESLIRELELPRLFEKYSEEIYGDYFFNYLMKIAGRWDPRAFLKTQDLNNMYIGKTSTHQLRVAFLYLRITEAIIGGHYYTFNDGRDMNMELYVSTEVTLANRCNKTVVLDATGDLTPHLHYGLNYTITSNPLRGSIRNYYVLETDLTKSKADDEEIIRVFNYLKENYLTDYDQDPCLVITWKKLKDKIELPESWSLITYKSTRGSNNFREYTNVVVLGSFYMTPTYYKSYQTTLQIEMNRKLIAVADLIQEIYRSGLRDGKSIDIYLALDGELWKDLYETLQAKGMRYIGNVIHIPISKQKEPKVTIHNLVINEIKTNGPTSIYDMVKKLKEAGYGKTIRKPADLENYITRKYPNSKIKMRRPMIILDED